MFVDVWVFAFDWCVGFVCYGCLLFCGLIIWWGLLFSCGGLYDLVCVFVLLLQCADGWVWLMLIGVFVGWGFGVGVFRWICMVVFC